jgi:hypothetical protein
MWASITDEGEKEVYKEFSGRNCTRAVAWKMELGLGTLHEWNTL